MVADGLWWLDRIHVQPTLAAQSSSYKARVYLFEGLTFLYLCNRHTPTGHFTLSIETRPLLCNALPSAFSCMGVTEYEPTDCRMPELLFFAFVKAPLGFGAL